MENNFFFFICFLAKSLIMAMVEHEANDRITAKQALMHDFFLNPYDLTHSETEDNSSIHEKLRSINSLIKKHKIIFIKMFQKLKKTNFFLIKTTIKFRTNKPFVI
jgi:hypothetical protein